MEYKKFEENLLLFLSKNNSLNLLLKVLDNPEVYFSLTNALNVKIKMEQTFLRMQENKYHKFIKNLIEEYLIKQNYEIMKNRVILTHEEIKNNQKETILLKSTFSFIAKDENKKEFIYIWAKKRDNFSLKKIEILLENYMLIAKKIINLYPDYKHKFYLWFIEETVKNNKENIFNLLNKNNEINFQVCYENELFKEWNDIDYFNSIKENQKRFKKTNYAYLNNFPNFDSDESILEDLVNLSENRWNLLMSPVKIYEQLRNNLFNLNNSNSNFYKAIKLRELKILAVDEEDYKNKKIAFLEKNNI
ncbi:hypothetical protein VBM87_00890 [Mycoplasma sp. 744]|uniref:HpyAIV family type II restriction enzyme n=1 Tax=Mycoplasma sp. 744 TaxID=3108531 RepID=UPI002B1D75B4|nr:hypothetical protein [Mycoplasma sp. 744]MEA4115341.1 hypothetical protein [Mycoplasma sp. 744]